jgi:hypothetical protein
VKLGSLRGGKSTRQLTRSLFDPCLGTSLEYRIDGRTSPPATAPSDKIANFNRGQLLYVVSPYAECSDYNLIGECYVDGLMDSKGLQLVVGRDHIVESIKLM